MSAWTDIKGNLKMAYDYVKRNAILDPVARSILENVPIVGSFLVKLYEKAGGSEEDKTKQILQILENLQKFSQEQLKDLEYIIKENGEQIKNNASSLSKLLDITGSVANKLDEIEDLIQQLAKLGKTETDQIKDRIAELEKNLLTEIEKLGVSEFDYTIIAERLLFYLKLEYFLRNSHSIFLEQNKIAHTLYRSVLEKGHPDTTDKRGLDYPLYELHKNNLMDINDLKIFNYIRGVTNDIQRFNWYAKELLMKNHKFVSESDLLAKLKVHYSTWHAKYQIYKDDPNMCLIYVGPDQNAGFPKGIDGYIDDMINQLKREIKL